MNKKQFEVLLLLYVANIDGQLHADEIQLIMEKYGHETFVQTKKMFDKMGDSEILECLRDNKKQFVSTETERRQLLAELKKMICTDERLMTMEERLYKTIEKILM
jgi:uncharacterized tellurite resistance protein B-like protein